MSNHPQILTEDVRRRYNAFWEHEGYGRAVMSVTYTTPELAALDPEFTVGDDWTNLPRRLAWTKERMRLIGRVGDSVPSVFTNFGPGAFSACIGGTFSCDPKTVWFENEPVITDWEGGAAERAVAFDPNAPMTRLIDDYITMLLEAGQGKFYTSLPDIGGTYDIIAALRGTQELLMDMLFYPEEIKAFNRHLQPMIRDYFLSISRRLMEAQGGFTSWMPIYSPVPYFPLQCDYSVMISPDMFGEFIRPDLEYQTSYMEHSVYHQDGVGQLAHTDHLLAIPRLSAIQWVPGAGKADPTDPMWFDHYRKIRAAGKSIVLFCFKPEGVERLLRSVSTKGLMVHIHCSCREEAEELVRIADEIGIHD